MAKIKPVKCLQVSNTNYNFRTFCMQKSSVAKMKLSEVIGSQQWKRENINCDMNWFVQLRYSAKFWLLTIFFQSQQVVFCS